MAPLRIELLGGVELHLASGIPVALPTRKSRLLLAYLALAPGRAQPRAKLTGLLWSDRAEPQARASLRQELHALRRGLAGVEPAPFQILDDAVALNAGAATVDALEFEHLAGRGDRESLARAAGLYCGDLLEGVVAADPAFEEWLALERRRFRDLAVAAFGKLLTLEAEQGAFEVAVATGRRLLTLDPVHEETYRALMRLLARQGQRNAALRQFQLCRAALARELGVEPEEATEQLHRELLVRRLPEEEADRLPATPVPSPAAGQAAQGPGRPPAPAQDAASGSDRVTHFLEELGLAGYLPAFRANHVDDALLPTLTDHDLRAIGVAAVGHRKRLLRAIAEIAASGEATAEPAPNAAAGAGSSAERRQLTVVFVDLVDSTALATRVDPEELHEVLGAYQGAVADEVTRFGGQVAKFMGDGVLACFGWPTAHEDDAERAVRAGLAAVAAVPRLQVPGAGTLACRVGIATGLVVAGVGGRGDDGREQAVLVGETPNLAARLQALAEAGTVVVAEATCRLLGGAAELADLGAWPLKGFAAPVRAWRVLGLRQAESRFEAAHGAAAAGGGLTPLVGRGEELALLLRRWELARGGEGQAVLLSGEPGIGKSRLARALRERLAGEVHVALLYQCSPYHTGTALHPVVEQLERAAEFQRDDPAAARLAKLEALLAEGTAEPAGAASLLAELLAIPTEGRYPALALTPQRRKELTLRVLSDQLAGLAARGPVLLVLEDAHWADPTTLELFGLAIDRVADLPVLVVVTFRPEFAAPWAGRAHAAALALSRLGRREAVGMVEGVAGGRGLPGEVVARIVAKTDGVPLFVEELTKAVLESGLPLGEGGRRLPAGASLDALIPATLQDSLMARLDRLAPVREVAQIGAAIGREFPHALLAAVAARPEAELCQALEQLAAAELVFRRGIGPDATYAFKHALVRDAAYESLLKSRRKQLHATIAQVVEERFPERVAAEPEMLARHCTEAGLADKAVEYWHQAGQQAVQRSAMNEAIAHLEVGLETLKHLQEGAERDHRELELQVTLGIALLAARGQAAPETGRAYARARELAERLGEVQHLLRILYGQSACDATRAEFRSGGEAAARLLRLAEEQDDEAGQAAGRRMLGVSAIILGDLATARVHLKAAIALPKATEHSHAAFLYAMDPWVVTYGWLSWPLLLVGLPEQACACHQEGLAQARERGHPNTLAQVLYCSCTFRQLCDRPEDVRDVAGALHELATEQAFPFWQAMAEMFEGWTLARSGEPDRATQKILKGLATYRATGAELWQPYFLALAAEVHEAAEQTDKAVRLLDEALDRGARTGERWYTAELHRMRGDILLQTSAGDSQAEASFRRAITLAREQGARWWELRAARSLARLWAESGERRRALDLLAPVYGWFSEGFGTPDLVAAKRLLDELG